MAEKTLKKVENQLNCTICLDTYTDPTLLQCFHVYCRQCLVNLHIRQRSLVLVCPICRRVTHIPARGVAGLPSAFHINQFLEIVDTHKKEEAGGAFAGHVPQGKVAQFCPDHDGKELELYCETCEELVCLKCVIKDGKHHSHDCKELNDAFAKCVLTSLKPLRKQMSLVDTALEKLDGRRGEISDQRALIKADIHNNIERLCKGVLIALEMRETELISQLDQITQKKLKGLAVQRDQVETIQAQLDSCLAFMKHSLQTGSQRDVLMLKTTIAKQVAEIARPLQPDILIPKMSANLTFSGTVDVDVAELCQSYGIISVESLDPSNCRASGKALRKTAVGKHSNVTLRVLNTEGTPFTEDVESVECELVTERTGAVVDCHVRRKAESKYCITYQATTKGRHQLSVKLAGRHIAGSPFSVAVRTVDSQRMTPLGVISEVSQPLRIAVAPNGEIIVSELARHCVSVFDQSGKKLRSFGGRGSRQGKFESPQGVAVDGEGNIFVADSGNHRIQMFTARGQLLALVEMEGSPCTVAFNPSNNRVYFNDGTDRIMVLNPDLTLSGAFGGAGAAGHHLMAPQGIAFNSAGDVYVADRTNYRIQVFSAEGEYLRTIAVSWQKLNWPADVAVDSTSGTVYVSLFRGDHVFKFNSAGVLEGFIGGCGHVRLSGPVGLEVDASGVLYVCNSSDNHVLML